jgi:hypothetical protein
MVSINITAKIASLTSGRRDKVWGFGEAERRCASALEPPHFAIFQPSDHRHVERVHHLPQEKGMLPPKLQRKGPILSPH